MVSFVERQQEISSIDRIADSIRGIKSMDQLVELKQLLMEEIIEVYIIKHFQDGNASKYNYPPLTQRYAARKFREVGAQPQLVYRGTLKSAAVNNSRVATSGDRVTLSVDVPFYGLIQINRGRDWITLSRTDERELTTFATKAFAKIRQKDNRVLGL
jgi:hypothetical protein